MSSPGQLPSDGLMLMTRTQPLPAVGASTANARRATPASISEKFCALRSLDARNWSDFFAPNLQGACGCRVVDGSGRPGGLLGRQRACWRRPGADSHPERTCCDHSCCAGARHDARASSRRPRFERMESNLPVGVLPSSASSSRRRRRARSTRRRSCDASRTCFPRRAGRRRGAGRRIRRDGGRRGGAAEARRKGGAAAERAARGEEDPRRKVARGQLVVSRQAAEREARLERRPRGGPRARRGREGRDGGREGGSGGAARAEAEAEAATRPGAGGGGGGGAEVGRP